MKKKSFAAADCPIARAVEIVGDWWSILIVRDALEGVRRFSEFVQLGVAKNILADRLKKLVAFGVLEVVPASDGSAYNEYALTQMGRELWVLLVAMRQWSDKWVGEPGEDERVLVDARDYLPVGELELRAHDGRKLELHDLRLVEPAEQARTA